MKFDVYFAFKNKRGVWCPGTKPQSFSWDEVRDIMEGDALNKAVDAFRAETEKNAAAELKKQIPAICFTGRCEGNSRSNGAMIPTGLVMIDIDHVVLPQDACSIILKEAEKLGILSAILVAHITASGRGLRIVFLAHPDAKSLDEEMKWFNETFKLERFGKFDAPLKDYSRLSFLPKNEELLYESPLLHQADFNPAEFTSLENVAEPARDGELFTGDDSVGNFTEEEKQKFEMMDYRGVSLRTIIDKWVEIKGAPGQGEVHNYYNDLVKNFRNIMNNDKRALLYYLPRFGHTAEECWSSIQSICRVNTLSTLPKSFYFFLKDNGFYKTATIPQGKLSEYMLADDEAKEEEKLPWMPPVFREFVKTAPKDFQLSVINALLPIMGTLTSYLEGRYYYDARIHTTSFFSVIYAPAGTGKGFVERLTNHLFEQLKVRDYVQQARENIFLRAINRKSQNDKSPDDPCTSLRIIPPKNSESEFLTKQKYNQGYHMFTYAAEMDSWAKGVKAAGGNKDDMIRIAWDNGEYGQQFKSPTTFKGVVNLYWNVLITGTVQQLFNYFKNVENGLITRCSFTTIDNQEFAQAPVWKELKKRDLEVIEKFALRCDRNSYTEPCDLMPSDIDMVSDDKFDEEVKWRFNFKQKKEVDMSWLRPTIDNFLESQLKKAALDLDKARDVFRRRVAVRGFRLGLMCYALWETPKKSDLQKCIPFIEWWMDNDLESSLRLWGNRYNNEVETDTPNLNQRSLFNDLPNSFSKNDVYTHCLRQNIKTPVRQIVHQWIKLGYCEKVAKGEYVKTTPKKRQ